MTVRESKWCLGAHLNNCCTNALGLLGVVCNGTPWERCTSVRRHTISTAFEKSILAGTASESQFRLKLSVTYNSRVDCGVVKKPENMFMLDIGRCLVKIEWISLCRNLIVGQKAIGLYDVDSFKSLLRLGKIFYSKFSTF